MQGEGENGEHGDDRAEVRDAVELSSGRDADAGPPGCGAPDQVGVVAGQVSDADRGED